MATASLPLPARPSVDPDLAAEIAADTGVDLSTAAILACWWRDDLDTYAARWDADANAARVEVLTAAINADLFG